MTMRTIDQVDALRDQLIAEGTPKPDAIRQLALATLEWPYVFGAWGERCSPAGRKKRARSDHPTIVSKCPALSKGLSCSPSNCKWGQGVRMYDCRGFTAWLLRQVGLDLAGQGATSQYNTTSNWAQRGKISDGMPDVVCCVFKQNGSTMEHTGMHIGGGQIIHCSVNVQTGRTSDKGWTHYAVPVGLYDEGAIPVTTVKPTLRSGAQGDLVKELQQLLTDLGYPCGEIDGKFGKKTLAAVKQFQQEHSLDPDGVVGRLTWTWLENLKSSHDDETPPEEEQTYTVKCYGMTWEKVMKIREICPTAELTKEV